MDNVTKTTVVELQGKVPAAQKRCSVMHETTANNTKWVKPHQSDSSILLQHS